MTVQSELTADRPFMPGYGIQQANQGSGLFPWAMVRDKMAVARNYWVATVRADDRPHAAPVWGLWVDDTFYFSTGRESRKAKNLTGNPAIVVHLESGDDVIIVEGNVTVVTDEATLDELDTLYKAKYQVDLMKEEPVFAVRPQTAYAWLEKDFGGSATRWQVNA
jgi:general stress protein 26